MSDFRQIVLVVLSGPGIAAPVLNAYRLQRTDLSEADASSVDAMLAACDFFSRGDAVPSIPIMDGPHKSRITVDLADGRSHSIQFLAATAPAALTPILTYVQTCGAAE